jgi:hypothetical protein
MKKWIKIAAISVLVIGSAVFGMGGVNSQMVEAAQMNVQLDISDQGGAGVPLPPNTGEFRIGDFSVAYSSFLIAVLLAGGLTILFLVVKKQSHKNIR